MCVLCSVAIKLSDWLVILPSCSNLWSTTKSTQTHQPPRFFFFLCFEEGGALNFATLIPRILPCVLCQQREADFSFLACSSELINECTSSTYLKGFCLRINGNRLQDAFCNCFHSIFRTIYMARKLLCCLQRVIIVLRHVHLI